MTAVASSALLILFGSVVIYLLLDVRLRDLSRRRRAVVLVLFTLVLLGNIIARIYFGNATYSKFYLFFVQAPLFVLFCMASRYKGVKVLFVLLTAIVLTAPTITIAMIIKKACEPTILMILASNVISYAIVIFLVYRFLKPSFNYMLEHGENRLFWMFSVIPILHYLYAYGTTRYQFATFNANGNIFLSLIPDAIVYATYLLLMYLFKAMREKNMLQNEQSMMAVLIEDAGRQMDEMANFQEQAKIYRHDMRHSFALIGRYLANGDISAAMEYIGDAQSDIDGVTPVHYCLNNEVNMIISAFAQKAKREGVKLQAELDLPQILPLSGTELCVIFSNALENAVSAAAKADAADRNVSINCHINKGNLLIYIENPYEGEIIMEYGVPQSGMAGHGLGVKSIEMIIKKYNGYCSFAAENNRFSLKAVLPLMKTPQNHDASAAC
ncbi:MAG: ATP-binding protein [Clostridia bacterium]